MIIVYGFAILLIAVVVIKAVSDVSRDLEEENRRINEELKKNRPWW